MTNLREHNDGLGDEVSLNNQIHFDPSEDVTRQEFRDEADITKILARFGAGESFAARQPFYGEWDFDRTFADTLQLLENANRLLATMPEHLRKQYPDVQAIILALATGELQAQVTADNEIAGLAAKPASTTNDNGGATGNTTDT